MNEHAPTHFGLFAGQGGFELAYESEGFRTVGISEVCRHANIVTAHWFKATNYGDITAPDFIQRILDTCPPIDCLTGGVPCQPASLLGARLGDADDRWLWDRTIEVTSRLRPRYAHFENPTAILTVNGGRAWNRITSDLHQIGYDCFWLPVPAAIFGAGHLRERLFIIAANADRQQRRSGTGRKDGKETGHDCPQNTIANSESREMDRRERGDMAETPRRWEGHHPTSGNRGQIPDEHAPANATDAGLQRHARMHAEPDPQEPQRILAGGHPAAPDLRGRANTADWWHEANTGISVLAHGISSRLAEASCRLTGNAVVPQAVAPFARAIRNHLQQWA